MRRSTTWTFLTNHAAVLVRVSANPEATLREMSQELGITERAVSRIVNELAESGYLVIERIGRRNRYEVRRDSPLRRPDAMHVPVGALIDLVVQTTDGDD